MIVDWLLPKNSHIRWTRHDGGSWRWDEGLFVGKEVVAILWIKRCNIKCYTAYNIPLRQDSVTLQTCYCIWFTRTSFLNTKEKNMHFFLLSFFYFIFLASFLFLGKKILFAVPFLQSFRALAPISFGLRLFKVVYRMTQTHVPHDII